MPSPLLTRLSGLITGSARRASAAAGTAVAAQDWEQLSAAEQEKMLADNEADRREIEEKKEPRKTRKHRNRGPKKPHTEEVVVLEEPAKEQSAFEGRAHRLGEARDLRAQPALAELGRALLDGGAEAAPASAPAIRPPLAPQPNRSQSAPPALAR